MDVGLGGSQVPLEKVFSFLTYPKRGKAEDSASSGVEIPLDDGKLCSMLRGVFDVSTTQCDVKIIFSSESGVQKNDVRNELLNLLSNPGLANAQPLATRLERATTGVSGMGLLFICIGNEGATTRLVISRFPADEGIVAQRSTEQLTVEFVDQVFLKSAYSYKAASYISEGKPSDLWFGHVVDRQINHGAKSVSDYWIVDFLLSELATTSAAGTKRLANAMKTAAAISSDLNVKSQIVAAAQLAANMPPRAMTIAKFCENFNFSSDATNAVLGQVNPRRLVDEKFKFDVTEFSRHMAYRQVELDNGAVLAAPVDKFNECFEEGGKGTERVFTTRGRVVDEKLKRTR